MRFNQLPPGACFEYQGILYRKLNSLTASQEDGGQTRLIPRSATVKPVTEASTSDAIGQLPRTSETIALNMLYQHCREGLDGLAGGATPEQIAALQQTLSHHYQRLLQNLSQADG